MSTAKLSMFATSKVPGSSTLPEDSIHPLHSAGGRFPFGFYVTLRRVVIDVRHQPKQENTPMPICRDAELYSFNTQDFAYTDTSRHNAQSTQTLPVHQKWPQNS